MLCWTQWGGQGKGWKWKSFATRKTPRYACCCVSIDLCVDHREVVNRHEGSHSVEVVAGGDRCCVRVLVQPSVQLCDLRYSYLYYTTVLALCTNKVRLLYWLRVLTLRLPYDSTITVLASCSNTVRLVYWLRAITVWLPYWLRAATQYDYRTGSVNRQTQYNTITVLHFWCDTVQLLHWLCWQTNTIQFTALALHRNLVWLLRSSCTVTQ